MEDITLSAQNRAILLKIARQAVEAAAKNEKPPSLELDEFPAELCQIGSSFVTLTLKGRLRGCIGGLEASMPLVLDVQEHAAAAAVEDYRFNPVSPEEVSRLKIEISRLTPPTRLDYQSPEDLKNFLKPEIDGVILTDGRRRATFLPQVWEKIPEVEEFLGHLCQKMGAPDNLWKTKHLEISTYQVEAFEEK